MSQFTETVAAQLAADEPEFWNSLVQAGVNERVIELVADAFATGEEVGRIGSSDTETVDEALDRTLGAFVTAYGTFTSHMIRTQGHAVPPNYLTIEGQLASARGNIIPRLFALLTRKFIEIGLKPMSESIVVAQEVPSASPGGLILP